MFAKLVEKCRTSRYGDENNVKIVRVCMSYQSTIQLLSMLLICNPFSMSLSYSVLLLPLLRGSDKKLGNRPPVAQHACNPCGCCESYSSDLLSKPIMKNSIAGKIVIL